jgi:rhodanese-related sulfurtransferase
MLRHVTLVAVIGLTAVVAHGAPPEPAGAPAATATAAAESAAKAAAQVVSIDQQSLLARLERADPDMVLLDVRTAEEFAAGHVPGARNIAHDVLGGRLDELADARHREVIVYCRSGRRSQAALEVLRTAGFTRLAHLEGDWLGWEAAGRPVGKQPVSAAPTAGPDQAPRGPQDAADPSRR